MTGAVEFAGDLTKAELRSRARSRRRERRRDDALSPGSTAGEREHEALRANWENACLFFGVSPDAVSALPALFMPLPTEPDVSGIVAGRARCLLPVLFDEAGALLSVPRWGIHVSGEEDMTVVDARWPAQPVRTVPDEEFEQASIVLVPALAVDRGGARLGQGGGWYDRALSILPEGVPVVAAVFDDEVVEPGLIPVEPHDRFVDGIICPSSFIPVLE